MVQILIINDNPFTRTIVRKMLQTQGYDLLEASTGKDGLKLAKQHHPALMICDWQMPGMNGLEVCRQVKAVSELSTTILILLTSRNG
jgi:phosphoserine phosphatase RsbU/P